MTGAQESGRTFLQSLKPMTSSEEEEEVSRAPDSALAWLRTIEYYCRILSQILANKAKKVYGGQLLWAEFLQGHAPESEASTGKISKRRAIRRAQ